MGASPALFWPAAAQAADGSATCTWRNLPLGGGGLVSGLVTHPKRPGLVYARADRGGLYRRQPNEARWQPLLDHLGGADSQLRSVLAIALDPQDARRVYLACGEATDQWSRKAAVLSSADGGDSWRTLEQPFQLGGYEAGRASGERLQVAPHDGNELLLGSSRDGLLRSRDAGAVFSRLAACPPSHVSMVLYEPGATGQVFYAGGVDRPGLFVTRDAGASFAPVKGLPAQVPQRAVFAPDGSLYVSFAAAGDSAPNPGALRGGSAWKRGPGGPDAQWRDVTPARPQGRAFGYGALDIDAQGRVVTAMLLEHWDGVQDELFLSSDGGGQWQPLSGLSDVQTASHPWLAENLQGRVGLGHPIAAAAFDTSQPGRLMCSSGLGVWTTDQLGTGTAVAGRLAWRFDVQGIEQARAVSLVSPSGGVMLFAALDNGLGGVAWEAADKAPAAGVFRPGGASHRSVDVAWQAPSIVARTLDAGSGGAVSTDGGARWRPFGAQGVAKDARGGHVAVSAKGGWLVWAPPRQPAVFSRDRGQSWQPCKGWPEPTSAELVPVAEKNAEGVFYVFDYVRGQVLTSVDGGASFALSLQGLPELNPVWQRGLLLSAPGLLRDLWLGLPDALVRAQGVDARVRTVKGVSGVDQLALGKAAPGRSEPSLFLAGRVVNRQGQELDGLFRTDDGGTSFHSLDSAGQRFGRVLSLAGDPLEHGTVYVGTQGRGVLVGRLAG